VASRNRNVVLGGVLPRSVVAVVVAFGMISPPPVQATGLCGNQPTQPREYALQTLPATGSNGIDGDIFGSVVTLSDPSNQAIVEWVGLVISTSLFVEIGQGQGCMGNCPASPCIYTPITSHLWAENRHCSGQSYTFRDLAQVPAPNYPVYVNWAGVGPEQGFCLGQASYEFPFRIGSWSHSPVAYGYLQSSTGYDEAALEVRHATTFPTVGRTYLGADNNHNVNSSYGLHTYVKSTNTWHLWSESSYPGTTCYDGPGAYLVYNWMRQWDAFYGDDSGTSNC
jgi:hypothetical protein